MQSASSTPALVSLGVLSSLGVGLILLTARAWARNSAAAERQGLGLHAQLLGSADLDLVKRAVTAHSDFPSAGVVFRDVFPVFGQVDTLLALVRLLHDHVRTLGKVDVIVGLDARGFLLGPTLAMLSRCAFVPVRKSGKLPGPCTSVTYVKEYGADSFAMQQGAIPKGSRCVIFDDLIATGGSLSAAADLIAAAQAHVVEACVIIELDALQGSQVLSRRELPVPVWALLHY
jgi:adenine phosphoribosyltransferase